MSRNIIMEQNVLHNVRRSLSTSVRIIFAAVGGSRSSVYRTIFIDKVIALHR